MFHRKESVSSSISKWLSREFKHEKIFAPHNVKDPPFTKLNIVMCRNMLIYMEAPLQKKLIELFNYSSQEVS
jgi:chemotaxis methyl-accepting protein methylase